MVLAGDPETGEVAYKEVTKTFVNESAELIHVHRNGEEIITTPTHPFMLLIYQLVLAQKREIVYNISMGNELEPVHIKLLHLDNKYDRNAYRNNLYRQYKH